VSSLDLASGGTTQSVAQLCEALNRLGAAAEIATVVTPGAERLVPATTPVHAFPLAWPARLRRSPGLAAFLDREAPRFDVLHVHALWQWPGVYGRRAALRHGKPLVLSPRGMLEPWSLQQRAGLKRLALATWEGRNLRACALLHATAESEAEGFRKLGLVGEIRVIPNGVELPPPPAPRPDGGPRSLLFCSRYHPKKGLDLLLQAWARLAPEFPDWTLSLHGPDPEGHRAKVEALARSLALPETRLRIGDALHGPAKEAAFAGADLFILPTYSENFGNVVAEALAHGVPVITTTGAPWQGLRDHGCGWWVPPELDALTAALREALGLSAAERRALGARGRAWMGATHPWDGVAAAMAEAYQSLRSTVDCNVIPS
jgi:glycosyltransferase involved in cell wall biosynthesis